jgi:hypothetical protein
VRFVTAQLSLILALMLTSRAALPPLPRVTGELQGEITIAGSPTLTWKLTTASRVEGRQWARLEISGDGLSLRGRIRNDVSSDVLSWQIDEGRINLARWLPVIAARFAPDLTGITAVGELSVSGNGALENDRPTGSISIEGHDISLQQTQQDWSLQNVGLTGQFALAADGSVKSTLPVELVVGQVTTTRFGARNVLLRGNLDNAKEFSVTKARLEIAGGEVETGPFTMPLSPILIDARVHISHVGLQDFVALVPSGLSDARGKLDGDLRVMWTAAHSLELGDGTLSFDDVEPTIIRLAPWPGFLTGRVPARIEFMPGQLGRWFSVANPSYDELQDIELGRADLQVSSLQIQLTPEGDGQGRSAHVLVKARPSRPDSSVKLVTFTINVNGPLAAVMNLGMKQPFSLQLH